MATPRSIIKIFVICCDHCPCTQEPKVYNPLGRVQILAVDCGIKNNQIRCLVNRGASVRVVPWDYDFNQDKGQHYKNVKCVYLWLGFVILFPNWLVRTCKCILQCKTSSRSGAWIIGMIIDVGFDGLFLSNGPGDPNLCSKTVTHLRTFIESKNDNRPVFGICLGHQLIALSIKAKTFKMKSV